MGRKRRKLLIFLLALVVLSSLLALAAGLSGLQFEPGQALKLGRSPSKGGVPSIPLDRWMDWLNHIFWGTVALLLLGGFIAMILSKEYRRELLVTVLIAVLLCTWGVVGRRMLWERQIERPDVIKPLVEEELPPQGTRISLEGVKAPPWSSLLLSALIWGAAGALAWWLLSRARPPRGELAHLAELAGKAAADLRSGAVLRDTVLRCYREMSELLARRQHIPEERYRALTPREFETLLRKAGVRDEHITQLSRLFERVRYGGRRTTPKEERAAIECLEAIERAYGGWDYSHRGRSRKGRDKFDVEPRPT